MRQRLFSFLSVVSLCVGIVTGVLWVRSYRGCDLLLRPARPGEGLGISSEFGLVVVEWEGPTPGVVMPGWEYFASPVPRRWPVSRGVPMPAAYRGTVRHFVRLPPAGLYGAAVPHWMLLVATAALPVIAATRVLRAGVRRRHAAQGRCTGCGYDLRATRGRCPECGASAAPPTAGTMAPTP